MYKLILVDDEEEVRKGILQKINWKDYGFEIAGEAENGREALEIAEKTIPDVVITDIKMPFMDGIALSGVLKEKCPTTKVVILTGFDDFGYAQKAINLNIIEYLLKPVSSQELIKVLQKIKVQLDEEVSQKENINALRLYYNKSLPILREKFLVSLVTNKLGMDEIHEKSKNYGLNLSGDVFVVSVANIDYNAAALKQKSVVSDLNAPISGFVLPEDRELLKFAILNIAEEIVSKLKMGITFLHNDNIVILTISKEDRETTYKKNFGALEELRQRIEKFLKITITIGIGMACDNINSVCNSYNNAITALDYRVILGNNRIIYIEDMEPQRFEKVIFDDIKQHMLASSIKVGTLEEIHQVINILFEELNEAKVSFKDYQVYLLEMLTAIFKVAEDLGIDMDNIFGANHNLFVEMHRFEDIQEVKEWVAGICIHIIGYITKVRQDTCKLLVNEAREYIQNCYSNSDLSIDKLCKHLHISPTYFSTIFKKQTKMTFVNFLTHVRMEAAKKLLRTTNSKTFEIAEKVGYSDPNYFSYCFKKNFNISPSEYRNSI